MFYPKIPPLIKEKTLFLQSQDEASRTNCGAYVGFVVGSFAKIVPQEVFDKNGEITIDLYDKQDLRLANLIQKAACSGHEIFTITEEGKDFSHMFAIEKISDEATTYWRIYQAFSGLFSGHQWLEQRAWDSRQLLSLRN